MEVFIKKYIKSEADLPKETGGYFVFHSTFGVQGEFYNNDLESRLKWLECYDWYLLPVELPSEGEQKKYLLDNYKPFIMDEKDVNEDFRMAAFEYGEWLLNKIRNER